MRSARRLAAAELDAVVSSPLLRARETAEAIARACGLEAAGARGPGAGRDRGDACATPSTGRGGIVAAVGHQPDCGDIFEELTGERRPFPTASYAELRAVSAIVVRDLHKSYGSTEAVRGIDFTIEPGEVFGLLGPNGAGKTTTVEILEGYRERDGGTVEVLGVDPATAGSRWREQVGVVLQSSSLYPNLTACREPAPVRRLLRESARPRRSGRARRARQTSATHACARCRADRSAGSTSASRWSATRPCCSSTSRRPGSIPGARRAAWDTVRALRALGKTIFLTTHYLDEAEQLADRVAVLRRDGSCARARRRS